MDNHFLLFGIIVVLVLTLLSGCFENDYNDDNYSSGQIWELVDDQSGQTATLTVDSSGYFTGSGWVGGGSGGIPSYNIYITNGRMIGTSITFDASASYNNGDGTISATGTGSLNANFPQATTGSGAWSGTISDPLGNRPFTNNWQGTKISGGNQFTPFEEFDFDVDVEPHIVNIKQGEIATINVTVNLIRGTSQSVLLTFTEWGSDFGINATLGKSIASPTYKTKLYIKTTCETPADQYLFTVRGETAGTYKTSVDSANIIVEEDKDCGSILPPGVPSKPKSLLASDAEYYSIYLAFQSWDFDFNSLFETYSNQGLAYNWEAMWIGSEDNVEHRVYLDRIGDSWRPRKIPA